MLNEDKIGRLFKTPKSKSKVAPVSKTTADVSDIVEEDHAKYRIKAGRLGGTFVARAFPKQSARAQGVIAEAKGDSEKAAISALMAIIEARDIQRTSDRRWDAKAALAIPSEMEFLEALGQARLSQAQVSMLRALAVADAGLTYGQLANAAGYKSKDTGEKVFRKIGELIADYLSVEITYDEVSNTDGPTRLLAVSGIEDAPTEDQAPSVWIMHEELRAAVRTAL